MTQDTAPTVDDELVRDAVEEDERTARIEELRSAE
jgi:hypothetical protein